MPNSISALFLNPTLFFIKNKKLTSFNRALFQIKTFQIYLSRPALLLLMAGFVSELFPRLSIQSLVAISWIPLLWAAIAINFMVVSILKFIWIICFELLL